MTGGKEPQETSQATTKAGVLFWVSQEDSEGFKKAVREASLVAQWLRICLPMQGTRVRALVWEDPTCRGATGPVNHNC